MISLLRQTISGKNATYVLERGGQTLCTAQAPVFFSSPGISLFRQGQPWLRITPDLGASLRTRTQNGARRTAPCAIADAGGTRIGSIAHMREGGLFSAICYMELLLSGRVLRIYEVGLGKEGMKYPIYDGGAQVALIEKEPVVQNNLDAYTLCSLDESGELAALLTALFLDFHRYRNAGERVRGKTSVRYVYTRKKEILATYDPAFRLRCETR